MDKGSTNHTYLNGEMLDAENSYVLSDHDSIQIADEEFTFYFDQEVKKWTSTLQIN